MLAKFKNLKGKLAVSTALMVSAVPTFAFAADSASDATSIVNSALTSGTAEVKSAFMGVIGTVVAAGLAIFAVKFAITHGIDFFYKLSKKS